MAKHTEKDFASTTDVDDLNATVHNINAPIEPDKGKEFDAGDDPQELTETYGTGVQEMPGYAAGGRTMQERDHQFNAADAKLTGGDIDANYEQAYAVGDEAVGGTAPTPDQDVVDELGAAVGLNIDDKNFMHANDIMEQRDERRWEMEPKSSEDYKERRHDEETMDLD